MNSAPRALDRFAFLMMALLCASWGLNQVAAKLAFVDIAPVTQAALRSGLGSIVLLIYAWRRRPQIFRADGTLAAGLVIGLLFAGEFIALFLSLRFTTASRAVVFLFTAPLFVGVGAFAFLPSERLRPLQWLGMGMAFLGVAVGFYRASPGATLQGDLLALLAGAFWGATTVVLKATKLSRSDPLVTLLYQTVIGAIASALYAFAIGEPFPTHLSAISALCLGYQSFYIVGFTYLVWFWLLKTYRAAELSAFTFTSPIVGVIAGWLILGDALTPSFLVAVAMVAAGILTINWPTRI
jgi:drug/metabolite transporter (DMT)-like permease